MTSAVEQKLAAMHIQLPQPVTPVANYVPFALSGNTVFVSGQLPMKEGKLQFVGKVGREFSVEQGQAAARLCGINLLAQLRAACGGNLDRVKRCLRLGVFVSATEEFTDHPKIANGVSDLMVEALGEAGKHARFAVGVHQLPFGVAVEVDAVFEIS